MNFVIVKQTGGKYLFEVPEQVTISAGEGLVLDTYKGHQTGVALCDSFHAFGETAEMIMDAWGTKKERMKPVLGFVSFRYFKEDAENA